jgi:hypothetical protein
MVHWVYVLECEDDYIYVGETESLLRRLREHLNHRGGANTFKHTPLRLIGLYKVNENTSFMEYRTAVLSGDYNRFLLETWGENGDNLLIENHITERFFYDRRDNTSYGGGLEWYKVRGGKYTRGNLDETVAMYKLASEKEGRTCFSRNPIDTLLVETIVDRPLCKCGNPSEVSLSKDKSKIYFVCALKYVWPAVYSIIDTCTPCDFWQPYSEDIPVKTQYESVKVLSREVWIANIPLSRYKIHPEPCISCQKTNYVAIFNDGTRRLCQTCLATKYDSLKEQYSGFMGRK